ncbi:MAG: lamin tail domain-containing protein [Acidobacteriaceae bacterium]|nr:lamin tail domain-containing protein [Acidobacteriaceae bacterium]
MFPLMDAFCALRRLCVVVFVLFAAGRASAQSTTIVISQVYGAGGNSGALLNADFVELFNVSNSTQSLDGYAIQYAAAASTTLPTVTALPSGISLKPGQYYLIAATAGTTGSSFTADDTESTIAFGAAAGKVFLTNTTTKLTSVCPGSGGSVVDFVAYGTTVSCSEGAASGASAAAPATSAILADIRKSSCTDTDNNAADFQAVTPAPRNSSTTLAPCAPAIVGPTLTSAAASAASVIAGNPVTFSVVITPGTGTLSTETINLSSLGGSASQALTAGSNGSYSYTYTVPSSVTEGDYTVTFTATDSNSLSSTATASLSVLDASTPAAITSGTIAVSNSAPTLGDKVTFSAVFAGNKGTPAGTVTLYDGTTVLGTGTPAGNGTWTYTTSDLALGSHSVTAIYTGDLVYTTPYTTPTPVTLTVSPVPVADFNLLLGNTALTASGTLKTQTMSIGVQGVNGFNDTVSFSCTGLPSGSHCTFSPESVTGSGGTTMTVAIDNAALHQSSPLSKRGEETVLAIGLLALPFALRRRTRTQLGRFGTLAVVLAFGLTLAGITGCGNDGTPKGSSTVTVTAKTASVTKTGTFTFNVQ